MATIDLGRVKGQDGVSPPISDSVTSPDSGVAASSLAVKTAYDRANTAHTAATNAQTLASTAVQKTGDTMTGALTVQGAIVASAGYIRAIDTPAQLTGVYQFGNQSGGARLLQYDGGTFQFIGAPLYSDNAPIAPRPSSAGSLGYFAGITTAATYTLPAGGTWAYSLIGHNASGAVVTSQAGIAAGGGVVSPGSGTTNLKGFIWRIA